MGTLLVIEKETKMFKVAVDLVGLTDFVAFMAYKPEWRRQETVRENPSFKGKGPDENLAAYMDISPVLHVDKIQTPLFVVATTGDKIAPWQLHTGRLLDALKAKGKVHESKIYENAAGGHVFTNGDNEETGDARKRILDFLRKYTQPGPRCFRRHCPLCRLPDLRPSRTLGRPRRARGARDSSVA